MADTKEKKPNFLVRAWKGVAKFFREARSELKKVVWPTGKTIVKSTGVVLASVAIVGAVVAAMDYGMMTLLEWVTNLITNVL